MDVVVKGHGSVSLEARWLPGSTGSSNNALYECGLAPVAFDQYPAASSLYPAMLLPTTMSRRRLFPAPRSPIVGVAVPILITRLPYIAATRGDTAQFHDGSGWSDANEHVDSGGHSS